MSNYIRYINKFWIVITILLCIVFAVLFTPLVLERIGMFWGILATVAGVIVIILSYVVRAVIFANWKREK